MFIDKVKIKVLSGSGGNGMVAWRREKFVDKGGPAGGDGGKGGNVYLIAEKDMSTLMDFKYKSVFKADNGENGRSKNQHGATGNNIYIKVPCGTLVKEAESGKIIGDLVEEGQSLIVAQGGRGGRGNARFATSIKRAPQFCEPGEPGIERELELELKLIADVGILGLPNAGKSTLISVISAARPKIADYPFTTLIPNLGVVKKPDGDGFVVADIPGLIEGASEGAGLGHEFLRHVERTRLLLHMVDLTMDDPVKNYQTINNELKKHGGRVTEIYQIIVLNKIDAIEYEKVEEYIVNFKEFSDVIFAVSAVAGEGIPELLNFLVQKVDEIPRPKFEVEVEEDLAAYDHDDSSFEIIKTKDAYVLKGGKVERLVSVTDERNSDQIYRLQNIFNAMGIFEALKKAGIQDGDIVRAGAIEFEYYS
jgi:GTP-binding protein